MAKNSLHPNVVKMIERGLDRGVPHRDIAKYLVSTANAINSPAPHSRMEQLFIPSFQSTTAQIQKVSMSTSHITVVHETRNTGVNNVRKAALKAPTSNLRANSYVPMMLNIAGTTKARCNPISLHPTSVAASAT